MKLSCIINVCSLISSAYQHGCIGILSIHLRGGENNGVIYLHNWNILV